MIDFLYAFGIGITFALGMSLGLILCTRGVKRTTQSQTDVMLKHQRIVENRLVDYVHNTDRIADALECINSKIEAK